MKYSIEFAIKDTENNDKTIATIKSFEDDTLEVEIESFLFSSEEEIDSLALSLKKCLIMWQG